MQLLDMKLRLIAARDFAPHKVAYWEQRIKEAEKGRVILNIDTGDGKHPHLQVYSRFMDKLDKMVSAGKMKMSAGYSKAGGWAHYWNDKYFYHVTDFADYINYDKPDERYVIRIKIKRSLR